LSILIFFFRFAFASANACLFFALFCNFTNLFAILHLCLQFNLQSLNALILANISFLILKTGSDISNFSIIGNCIGSLVFNKNISLMFFTSNLCTEAYNFSNVVRVSLRPAGFFSSIAAAVLLISRFASTLRFV